MKKFGRILLLCLNILIDIFVLVVVIFLALWLFWGIPPERSVQRTMVWIENTWDGLTGRSPKERTEQMSARKRERAHRNIYVEEENKQHRKQVTQPYKYEVNLETK